MRGAGKGGVGLIGPLGFVRGVGTKVGDRRASLVGFMCRFARCGRVERGRLEYALVKLMKQALFFTESCLWLWKQSGMAGFI